MLHVLRLYIPLFNPFVSDLEARLRWLAEGEEERAAFERDTQRGIQAAPLILGGSLERAA